MATSQDLMFKEYPLVVRDVTAAQFAAQNVPPPHPGVIYRVDGAASYQWNGSAWVPYVTALANPLTGGIVINGIPFPGNGLRAVLFGHSYADGEASTGSILLSAFKASGSVVWANALLGHPMDIIAESGIGGERTFDVFPRYATDVAPYDPDILFIELGHNDLKGYQPVGKPVDSRQTQLPFVVSQFESWIAGVPRHIMVVILGENPPGKNPSNVSDGYADKYLAHRFQKLNKYFQRAALHHKNVIYIPADIATIDTASVDGLNTVGDFYDYVHPGMTGAYKRGKLIATYLDKVLPKVPSRLPYSLANTFNNLRMTVTSVSQAGGEITLLFNNLFSAGISRVRIGDKITVQSPNDVSLNGVYTVIGELDTGIKINGNYTGTPTGVTFSPADQIFDNPLIATQTGGNNYGTGTVTGNIPSQFEMYPSTGETWVTTFEPYTDSDGKVIGSWMVLTMTNASGGAHESYLRAMCSNNSSGNTLYRRVVKGNTYQFVADIKIDSGSTGFSAVRSVLTAQYATDAGSSTDLLQSAAMYRDAAYETDSVPSADTVRMTLVTPEVLLPARSGERVDTAQGRIFFKWSGNGSAVVRIGRVGLWLIDDPVQRQPVAIK